jgi:hypothetical protein
MGELDQDGHLSEQRYAITFQSGEFRTLYDEAVRQSESPTWQLYANRGKEFPISVAQVAAVNLESASSADLGALITYFAYRKKSIEDTFKNIKCERL